MKCFGFFCTYYFNPCLSSAIPNLAPSHLKWTTDRCTADAFTKLTFFWRPESVLPVTLPFESKFALSYIAAANLLLVFIKFNSISMMFGFF